MKYTFQDSTEFPVQRDFIQDLQDFIDVSKEVIPLERSAIKIKEENRQRTAIVEDKVREIDHFQKEVTDFVEKITQNVASKDILEIKREIMDSTVSASSRKRDEELEQLDQSTRHAMSEIKDLESKMFSILSPFFETGVYGAKDSYSAFVKDKRLIGHQLSSIDNMQYEFDLTFTDDMVKVEDLHELKLPIWSKGGILHKEDKMKHIDVSDFYVVSIDYDGNDLKIVIKDKDSEHKFTISGDGNTCIIHYGDYDITGDDDLAGSINMEYVDIFAKRLIEMFSSSIDSKELTRILLNNKDAMDDNRIFECIKIIASRYGELVKECIEKGYAKDEVTIKMEQPDGTRTEKFLAKSDILSQLSSIGSEGLELAGILRVTTNRGEN